MVSFTRYSAERERKSLGRDIALSAGGLAVLAVVALLSRPGVIGWIIGGAVALVLVVVLIVSLSHLKDARRR
jgi:FtsH-binding integral membrane protein